LEPFRGLRGVSLLERLGDVVGDFQRAAGLLGFGVAVFAYRAPDGSSFGLAIRQAHYVITNYLLRTLVGNGGEPGLGPVELGREFTH
jgi:hypothetical protein